MKTIETAVIAVLLLLLFLTLAYILFGRMEKKQAALSAIGSPMVKVEVEIANNPLTRMKGLMGRKTLDEYSGMLFVFDKEGIYPFWMFNTTIPLDAIYIDSKGNVVDIIEMDPCKASFFSCPNYVPKAEARYVLEVNKGFSRKHGIVINSNISIIEEGGERTHRGRGMVMLGP